MRRKQPGHTREPSWRKQQALAGSSRQQQRKKRSVARRVRQFPGQGFMVSKGKVFSQPCAKELSNDKDICKSHIGRSSSRKPGSRIQHEINLAKWEAKKGEASRRKLRLEKWREGRTGAKASETAQQQRTMVTTNSGIRRGTRKDAPDPIA